MIEISVVIPTCNRCPTLLRCLQALGGQPLSRSEYEVIVVDDGSTDDTQSNLQPLILSGIVRYYYQPNSGPARARNVGIRAAQGRIIVFLGDDILAGPHLLEEHLSLHRQFEEMPIAVLGYTDWSKSIDVTPLMTYEGKGSQFGYHHIEAGLVDPNNLPYGFFYTSNVSVRRQFLIDHELWFDEDFAYAMGEDGELAYRMQKKGLRIVYNLRALAYHEHPTTFESICHRSFLKGQVAVLQVKKHPEWGNLDFLNLGWKGKVRRQMNRWVAWWLSPFLRFVDQRRWSIHRLGLRKWYDFVFQVHQLEGLICGMQIYNVELKHMPHTLIAQGESQEAQGNP